MAIFPLALVVSTFFLGAAIAASWDRDTLLLYGGFVEDMYNKINSSSIVSSGSDYRITRDLYAAEKTGSFFGEPLVWIGCVAISDSRQNVVVVFRGTSNPGEWAKNLLVSRLSFTYLNGSTANSPGIHDGFLSLYTESDDGKINLRQQTVEELRSLASSNPGYSISFVGHSLGGALATLAAFDVANSDIMDRVQGKKLSVYTFASPMVGDETFKQLVEEEISALDVLRVSDIRDVVPYLPSLNYVHVGEDFTVDGCQFDGNNNGGDVFSKVIEYHSLVRYMRTVSLIKGDGITGGCINKKDLEGVMEFVRKIISKANAGWSGFKNLVLAMKHYVQNFSASCTTN
ncbi:hypothetical protein SELMODRAFT_409084 [Selaginella moellendorffii]|uniref:Fungal lipase-type domain-containing protein n=1 Tax=Selaginella moellendorffii TaxID=88036 RepID=D8R9D6_SELML|nr:phospholipase A1-IIgamma [Selaginella moellendorffii]EFJ31389.1 hypothetical protein SELMODRAFT_409084 [Selaginella moellendorffii]|eukprot:XP_002968042.1 phospholipase A1-IIgamma [Selaginella moellendorffii]